MTTSYPESETGTASTSSMDSLTFWLFLLLSVHATTVKGHNRLKTRSILDLTSMIKCSTGRSISYIVYGCYCGLGGKGWPRDSTDWCCFAHDCCYERVEQAGCQPKFDHYDWHCQNGTPGCGRLYNNCEKITCDCDVRLSKCLKKAAYQNRFALWPNFFCGKRRPSCEKYRGIF
ncbi:group 10 secretory phospholipase A2 [Mobula hypostoma]|uniref:group 10 secretory phospholipase A2 n=1 Tax=Mobula hypostoma TaxID=723540 RepID=UPI002FC3A5F1